MSLAAVAGWGGAALSTLTALVQAVRVHRRGPDGVNAMTWSLFLVMSAFWVTYGMAVRSPEIVASSVAGAPFMVWLLTMLDAGERWHALLRATAAVSVAAALPGLALGWNTGLLGLGVLIVATRLPQLTQLVRARHAHGVSTSSWLLGAAGVALWLAYYALTAKTFAAVTMTAALTTNLAIAGLACLRHRGARARTTSLDVALAAGA